WCWSPGMARPRSSTRPTAWVSARYSSSPSRRTSSAGPSKRSSRSAPDAEAVMQPQTGTQAPGPAAAAEVVMSSLHGGLQWAVDRMLSIAYGLVYDYIFDEFGPYQQLRAEVLGVVEASAAATPDRRAYQVVDVDCGPGNLTFVLAEAGFSVLGLEPYGALVELAREKRRAKRLANLAFSQGDLAKMTTLRDASFDQVVNIHSLYAHADPQALIAQVRRVLKPGGHAIFVNH